MPVSYANDANAAAFGEFWVGTVRNMEVWLYSLWVRELEVVL